MHGSNVSKLHGKKQQTLFGNDFVALFVCVKKTHTQVEVTGIASLTHVCMQIKHHVQRPNILTHEFVSN